MMSSRVVDASAEIMSRPIYVGDGIRKQSTEDVAGEFVSIGGERYYRISNYDRMPPFFMSIVSSSDNWMFVSSNGALTAGRKNPEHALFPYYSVDKIHDSHGITGGKTLLLVDAGERLHLWEPFAQSADGVYDVQRNLYKNKSGNKLIFEELNRDLDLSFQAMLTTSDLYGFVRKSTLERVGTRTAAVRVLDGIQNILPYGTDRQLQAERSNLLDAYKKNELLPDCGLALFLLSSIPVDKPEPSESLSATTVWSVGLQDPRYLLSTLQLDHFREGHQIETEVDIRAERGAYFVSADLTIAVGETIEWYIVAEVNQGPDDVVRLRNALADPPGLQKALQQDVVEGTTRLRKVVAAADGLQLTADEPSMVRHFSNVLFNVMRGGTFADGYRIDRKDLVDFVGTHNRRVLSSSRALLESLPDPVEFSTLLEAARAHGDPDLTRLCYEYLPLIFSRRHGDPSRPWNYFSIDMKADDGSPLFSYQGNWRDIFQNWEALLVSFPEFSASIISKFVNASTQDGYNPYRITRNGIDWETEDPSDPWSFIGYWGDHQIIYLLKLLEISRRFHPGELESMLVAREFAFANVPYRIRGFDKLIEDPHSTIDFDAELDEEIQRRVRDLGADGRLLWKSDGQIERANLLEKLLVTILTKYSNFIPEAGIWLNTQRPEWNDANNALVGFGVSMVTLCYVRRFQHFLRDLLETVDWDSVRVSSHVADFLAELTKAFRSSRTLLGDSISDRDRLLVMEALGRAGDRYRNKVYDSKTDAVAVDVSRADVLDFIDVSLEWTDHTIKTNRRADGLYHSYNLMKVDSDGVSIDHLYEMLEGQVAVLSCGLLSPAQSVDVLDALKASKLFRPDQYSYLLYPDRRLPRFTEKNRVPEHGVANSRLLTRLLADGDRRLVTRDDNGVVHFNGTFRNRDDVGAALDRLSASGYRDEVTAERDHVLELFEEVFDHRSYTGRSGTFFGFEGLGCIYWHMVSKLLLATGETYARAAREEADAATRGRLVDLYYSIRAGIGLNKSPDLFGAFPTDPYSHTPSNGGAKQPGMTGQVKEDILARWEELGVVVENGCLSFAPSLLRSLEFLGEGARFEYFDVDGIRHERDVGIDELAFTYCQVPIVFRKAPKNRITVLMSTGERTETESLGLNAALSREVFRRSGRVTSIEVEFSHAS